MQRTHREKVWQRIGMVLCLCAVVGGCRSGGLFTPGQAQTASLPSSMEEITGKASLVQLLSPRSLAAPRTLPATSEGVVTTAYQPGSETASSIALGKPGTLPPTVIHTSTDSVKDSRVTTEIPSPATQIEPPAVHPL